MSVQAPSHFTLLTSQRPTRIATTCGRYRSTSACHRAGHWSTGSVPGRHAGPGGSTAWPVSTSVTSATPHSMIAWLTRVAWYWWACTPRPKPNVTAVLSPSSSTVVGGPGCPPVGTLVTVGTLGGVLGGLDAPAAVATTRPATPPTATGVATHAPHRRSTPPWRIGRSTR